MQDYRIVGASLLPGFLGGDDFNRTAAGYCVAVPQEIDTRVMGIQTGADSQPERCRGISQRNRDVAAKRFAEYQMGRVLRRIVALGTMAGRSGLRPLTSNACQSGRFPLATSATPRHLEGA